MFNLEEMTIDEYRELLFKLKKIEEKKLKKKVEELSVVDKQKICDLLFQIFQILCKIGNECGLDD